MEKLLLDSLEIRNFRAFQHLRIERLGRVNLIVGKNSVGKTSLLEALSLYAQRGALAAIWQILEARDEGRRPLVTDANNPDTMAMMVTDTSDPIKHLFYGRQDIEEVSSSINIGSTHTSDDNLSIFINWEEISDNDTDITFYIPILHAITGKSNINYPIDAIINFNNKKLSDIREIRYIFATSNGFNIDQIVSLWDMIALTDLEQDVLTSLRIIAPDIERINLVSSPTSRTQRLPVVRIKGTNSPIPLRSIGEGLIRIFGITLALVNAKDGLLLIDEIESGLHYSAQLDLWRLIFQVARRLNVQVFATTHSWDCIEAFQQAAHEDNQAEGMLIRLGRKKGDIVATLFDEEELAIATREQIEVR